MSGFVPADDLPDLIAAALREAQRNAAPSVRYMTGTVKYVEPGHARATVEIDDFQAGQSLTYARYVNPIAVGSRVLVSFVGKDGGAWILGTMTNPGVRVEATGGVSQTFPANTLRPILFGGFAEGDPNNFALANSQFIAPTAGRYLAAYTISVTSGVTVLARASFLGGPSFVTIFPMAEFVPSVVAPGGNATVSVSRTFRLARGQGFAPSISFNGAVTATIGQYLTIELLGP